MPPSSSICFRRLAGRRDSASLACFLKHGGIWFDPLGRFAGFAPEYGRASPPGADRRDACQFAHWPCALFAIGGRDAGPWHAAKIVGEAPTGCSNLLTAEEARQQRRPLVARSILMTAPAGRGFPVLTAIAMRRRHDGPRLYFRAPMPSLCHSRPSSLTPRVSRESGHAFTLSGAMQKYLGRIHRLSLRASERLFQLWPRPKVS